MPRTTKKQAKTQSKDTVSVKEIRKSPPNQILCRYSIDEIDNGWLVQLVEVFNRNQYLGDNGSYSWYKSMSVDSFEEAVKVLNKHRAEMTVEKLTQTEERDEVPF